ncbi:MULTISPECIES: transporter [unclassified Janthinobacterium]|uniref:transporter n=1 Tax=unclassified Janthinobacterium TaxID=2610881 RepID=UPI001E2C3F52|nr:MULTISPECIES: transporter [unclassified Janthinobacterium]MEC5162000.1 hypothetical protein [Janthinobacterium sp. CG_S6]
MSTVKLLAMLALAALATPSQAQAQDEGGVSPYRPSVSSPAQLPRPGQLELELGGLSQRGDGARRNSIPYTLKLAFSEQWGILLGGEAQVSSRDAAGQRAYGLGDTALVLKRAFLVDDATAFGLELGAKAATAKSSIGSGENDYTLNGIFSKDAAVVHMDLNLNLTALGDHEAGAGRVQNGESASFSTALDDKWGATAELARTQRRGEGHTAQLLLATFYSPSKSLVFDAGLARGLSPASPRWSLFGGVVFPLARLW